jgi:hypothetical protein
MKVCLKKSGEFPKKEEVSVVKKFVQFLQSQLPLNKKIQITFTDAREVPMTTGVRMPGNEIFVLAKGRLLIDILRTISHEWVHEFQSQKMGVKDNVKIQDIGGPEENMCNILSGVFIKKFEKKYPDTIKFISKPAENSVLTSDTIIMNKMNFDYRITMGATKQEYSTFVEWAENNAKIKLTKSCTRDLNRNKSWGGTHFYVTGDNNLLMTKMHLGGTISKVQRIIHQAEV